MKRQVALDTETTGKSDDGTPGDHRIIEIGCVEIIDRKITGREFQVYLDPEREVDAEATKVHGYTWDMLKGKPKFRDIAYEFRDFIMGSELLIHNAKFDTSFMDKEFGLVGFKNTTKDIAEVTDTVSLAMKLHPGHQVNLDNLCNLFGISNKHRVQHGALLDAQLLAEVYLAMTGGQRSFDLTVENTGNDSSTFKRPNGFKFKVMNVESCRHAKHVSNLIELAQSVKFSTKDEQAFGGSAWGDEYTMPYLEKGKEEDKKAYKQRLKQQKAEMMSKLLNEDELKILAALEAEDLVAYEEWKARVLGTTTP